MKPFLKCILITLTFIFLALMSLSLHSIQRRAQELKHEVTVTLKLIQVYVTDNKGNPIVNLEKDDFEIYDNGNLKTVTEFEKHVMSFPVSIAETQPKKEKAVSLPKRMNRKFFLLFDFAFNNATGIKKSKEAALHFIDTQLQPSDEVGVLSYSAIKGLTLHEYLTFDHDKVREVVEGFGLKDALGRAHDFELKYYVSNPEQSHLSPSYGSQIIHPLSGLRTGIRVFKYHAANFALKMKNLAKSLSYISGYKNIIIFSSGIPSFVMYGKPAPVDKVRYMIFGDFMARSSYEKMIKELATSSTFVYALNAEELDASIHKDDDVLGGYSLQRMVKVTGGEYFGSVYDYKDALDEIQNGTGNYYVLGYYIDEKWDGKYHKIKVKVRRKGCNVRAQQGYLNPKPFSKYNEYEKKLHLIDLALGLKPLLQTPLRFPVKIFPYSDGKKPDLILISEISEKTIQEISGKKVEMANLIFDKDKNLVQLKKDEELDLRSWKGNVYYYSLLSLSPGEYECRVVMRNLKTGQGAVASSSVVILEPGDPGLACFPPLLLKPKRGAMHIKMLQNVFKFDSSQYAPLIGGLDKNTSQLLAVVKCSTPAVKEPKFAISAYLTNQLSREKLSLTLSTVSVKKEIDESEFLVKLQWPELLPGKYSLAVITEELMSESRYQVNSEIRVK